MSFGNKIKELRKGKNITQKELAEAVNVALGTVAGYEVNKTNPSPDVLLRIADFFDISMDELFGRNEYK